MGKVRRATLPQRNEVVVEHPDGGTFGIIPMGFDDATEYAELVSREDFERDNGSILWDPKGKPVKKNVASMADVIEFAKTKLSFVRDFDLGFGEIELRRVDKEWMFVVGSEYIASIAVEGGQPIAAGKVLHDILTLMGTDEIEVDPAAAEGNGTLSGKVKKPLRENLFLWVTRKSAELAAQRNEIARGN